MEEINVSAEEIKACRGKFIIKQQFLKNSKKTKFLC